MNIFFSFLKILNIFKFYYIKTPKPQKAPLFQFLRLAQSAKIMTQSRGKKRHFCAKSQDLDTLRGSKAGHEPGSARKISSRAGPGLGSARLEMEIPGSHAKPTSPFFKTTTNYFNAAHLFCNCNFNSNFI